MIIIDLFNGIVLKICIWVIILIDNDKKEVIVLNKVFIIECVVNWVLINLMICLVISIGVVYGLDLELVKKLLF